MEPKKETAPAAAPAQKTAPEIKPAGKVEVNRELAALGAKAAEADKLLHSGTVTGAGPAAAPPMPAPPDTVAEVRAIIGFARPAVEMLVPYLRGADASAWDALVEPAAALCAHYGFSLGNWMQNPWARLAGAAVPLALHGFNEWQKAQAKENKPAALPANPAAVVPPGPLPGEKPDKMSASKKEPSPSVAPGVNITL